MQVMPAYREGKEATDETHLENIHHQYAWRRHEFFLRARPYKGEPPTVAGFLLYPDTPAKMKTTSQEAFRFRPVSQRDSSKGDRIAQKSPQELHRSHPASSRQTGQGNIRRLKEEEQAGSHDQKQDTKDMMSQYQKDFPPMCSDWRRRTPALPQPDNIGINPAFRIEFRTIQRDTYPAWPVLKPTCTGRLRVGSSEEENAALE